MISRRRLFCSALMLVTLGSPERLTSEDLASKPDSMVGKLIQQPEQFSGLWEMPTRPGHAVGIWLQLTTRVEGAATVLSDVAQYEQSLSVVLFQRNGNQLVYGDDSGFSDAPDGALTWDGKHLKARRGWRDNSVVTTEINLAYDATAETWSGFYRRGGFAKVVTLRRSGNVSSRNSDIIAGTWADTETWSHGCIHIARRSDGSYAGWSDLLQTPGTNRYANGLGPPSSTDESYGKLVRVTRLGRHRFSIEFMSMGICCSQTAVVTLVGHRSLSGSWQPDSNRSKAMFLWRRLGGRSCRV